MGFSKLFILLTVCAVSLVTTVAAATGRRLSDAPVSVSVTVVGGSYISDENSDVQLPPAAGLLSSLLDVEVQQILREQQAVADQEGLEEGNGHQGDGNGAAKSKGSFEHHKTESRHQISPGPSGSPDKLNSGLEG